MTAGIVMTFRQLTQFFLGDRDTAQNDVHWNQAVATPLVVSVPMT
ncbi:MAG TPA: hypothetical protein VN520_26660 [Streptomyces sp.]|nr:hypothetical protein [Streptomyces sp.]HWU09912.1 hypothetical protein [Streptomyces sp.]